MILQTATVLALIGFATWLIGLLLDYRGVAVIGAVIVVGVGAAVTEDGGLTQKTGEIETTAPDNTTEVEYQYEPVETPGQLNLGVLIMLLGGVLVLHGLNDAGGGGF